MIYLVGRLYLEIVSLRVKMHVWTAVCGLSLRW